MFKNLFRKRNNDYKIEELINFSIDSYIEKYDDMLKSEEETDLVYNLIFKKVNNELLACQLLVFIPIAFTREFYIEYKDKLADNYIQTLENGISKSVKFEENAVYMSILNVVKNRIRTMNADDIFKILEWSAEFRIIDYAEQQGVEINSISPPTTGNI
jgi:adenosine deaminase